MSGFETTTDVMFSTATAVKGVNEEIQGRLAALRANVADSEAGWRGSAQGAFINLMSRWDTEARRMSEALDDISRGIASNGKFYEESEANHAAQMNQVGGALSPF